MTLQGMDVGAVEALARSLAAAAEELERLRTGLAQQLGVVHWEGADGQRSRDDWALVHGPALTSAAALLTQASQQLLREALEQLQASDAGGLHGSAGGSAGAGTTAGGTVPAQDGGRGTVSGQEWRGREGSVGTDVDVDRNGVSAEVEAEGFTGVRGDLQGTYTDGDLSAQGTVHYEAGVHGEASAGVRVGPDGVTASAEAGVRAGASVDAQGSATYGIATVGAAGSAAVVAAAQAKANAKLGPDGVKVGVSGSAMVGAKLEGSVSGEVMGVTARGGGYVMAGAGVEGKADIDMGMDRVKVDVKVGASIGIGAGVNVAIDVSPKEFVNDIKKIDLNPWD